MEFTRELYWNVGHGIATLVPMYLLAFAAVALLVRGFIKRRATYLRAAPIDRVDQPLVRLTGALGDMLSQRQVSRVLWPGLAHAALFWGFFCCWWAPPWSLFRPTSPIRFLAGYFLPATSTSCFRLPSIWPVRRLSLPWRSL